jgi:Uma2 family endonuclease
MGHIIIGTIISYPIALAMTVTTAEKTWTDAELMALSSQEHRYELVNNELVDMGLAGAEHGYIACILISVLGGYIRQNKLGMICDSSTAFALNNGNRRSPDISFVRRERLQGLKRPPQGFFPGSPDLAVEILSPANTVAEIHDKIVEYFANDTRLVWLIHPDEKYILVYRSPQPEKLLGATDMLTGEDVVPGFTMPVADLFAEWDF